MDGVTCWCVGDVDADVGELGRYKWSFVGRSGSVGTTLGWGFVFMGWLMLPFKGSVA